MHRRGHGVWPRRTEKGVAGTVFVGRTEGAHQLGLCKALLQEDAEQAAQLARLALARRGIVLTAPHAGAAQARHHVRIRRQAIQLPVERQQLLQLRHGVAQAVQRLCSVNILGRS